jgi:hypothetical protein
MMHTVLLRARVCDRSGAAATNSTAVEAQQRPTVGSPPAAGKPEKHTRVAAARGCPNDAVQLPRSTHLNVDPGGGGGRLRRYRPCALPTTTTACNVSAKTGEPRGPSTRHRLLEARHRPLGARRPAATH